MRAPSAVSNRLRLSFVVLSFAGAACASGAPGSVDGTGGSAGKVGPIGSAGASGSAGTLGAGGMLGSGGSGAGGVVGTGGAVGAGGAAGQSGSGGGAGLSGAAGTKGTGGAAGAATGVAGAAGGAGTGGSSALVILPSVKVDFDIQGRPSSEATALGYTAWPVTAAATTSMTLEKIVFTFAKVGANGAGLTSTWSKVAVDVPNYARLAGDGMTVDGGDAGGAIQMTIRGLPAGPHTLVTYHNQVSSTAMAPVNISVNGTLTIKDLTLSSQVLSDTAAQTALLQLQAQAGQDVVVLFQADTSSSAASKNVIINGFELDRPDPKKQATNPSRQRRRARRRRQRQRHAVVEGRPVRPSRTTSTSARI